MPFSPSRPGSTASGNRIAALLLACLSLTPFSGVEAAPPKAPAGLTASMTFPQASPTGAKAFQTFLFQWEDRSIDETGFELFARIKGQPSFTSLGTIAANSTLISTRLSSFPGGTHLEFRLRSFKGSGTSREFSGFSGLANLTIPSFPDFSAPTGLTATDIERDTLLLTWADNSEQEDYFVIEFKLKDASSWQFYALPLFNITRFELNSGLDPGQIYHFRVRGLRLQANTGLALDPNTNTLTNQNGTQAGLSYSAPTNFFSVNPIKDLSNPPSRMSGTATDESTMRLNWFDESDKEHAYEVQYRQTTATPPTFTFLDYADANSTSYEIGNLQPLTTVTWRVRAAYQPANQQRPVYSLPSAEVTITTPFYAPTEVVALASPDSDLITLRWKDNSKVETGYAIYSRPPNSTNSSNETLQKTVDAGVTTTTVSGLTPGAEYEFVIRAYQATTTGAVLSDPSAPVRTTPRNGFTSATPPPLAAGGAVSYQAQTSSPNKRVNWTAEGLPPGVEFDSTSGLISGTPTKPGIFTVTLKATFSDGSTNQKAFTIRAALPPSAPIVIPAGNRTVAPSAPPISIPLAGLFKDPDTETAVRLSTTIGNIDVILFSAATPRTVANFLAYVDDHRYDGLAFHRSVPNFVIQGGAYKPVEAPNRFQTIRKFASPLNEPGISNLAKTIAMAKLGDDPNSASSEFFFNLADSNAANLNVQNGGFTAFARVSNSSWSVVQTMAQKPASPYAYELDDVSTTDVSYSQVAYNSDFPWPMNPEAGDANYPDAPPQMDNARTILINSATRIQDVLTYSVTGNSNPDGVSATISGSNLLISGPTAGAESQIQVTATDLDGNSVNQSFTVRVQENYLAPVINQAPVNQTALLGREVTFSVQAVGSQPLTYQWRKDGQDLSGKTGPNLTIAAAAYSDQGSYSVVVRNEAGSATSSAATLTVQGMPSIASPPASLTRTYGYSASFAVVAVGPGPLRYQWLQGNTRIRGATASTYTIPVTNMTHAGTYRVVVTNSAGSVTSPAATLAILPIDTDGDGVFDHEELAAKANLASKDSDGDGYDDAVELEFGGNPALASKVPTAFFAARADGPAVLRQLPFRRVPATANPSTFVHTLDNSTKDVAAYWLGAYEVSNRQFASILDQALKNNRIQIEAPSGGRRAVKYQSELVCLLATHLATDPGNVGANEVSYSERGGFFVPASVADYPVRGVTWHGAYLATVVLNEFASYTNKTLPGSWSYSTSNGFYLPSDAEWEWAAQSGSMGLTYPTGATVTATQANFDNPTGKPKPVISFGPNAFGLFNLAGNVAEWVFDSASPSSNAFTRGGSWSDPSSALANNARSSRVKTSALVTTGIRLALKHDPATGGTTSRRIVTTDRPLTIDATSLGAPSIAGQWYKDDVIMPGRTSPVLTFPAPKLSDSGSYKFTIANLPSQPQNGWNSPLVRVAIVNAPLTQQTITSALGSPVTFRIPYSGPGLTFLWQKDSVTISDGETYDLVTPATTPGTASLTVLSPVMDSAGLYTCRVIFDGAEFVTIPFKLSVQSPPLLVYDGPATVLNATYQLGIVDSHPLRGPGTVSISGLPSGLSYDRVTGLITGQPKKAGLFRLWVTVRNLNGTYAFPFNLYVQSINSQTLGTFTGTVARHSLNNNLGGRIDITTSSKGSYSGRLTLGTVTHRISGALNSVINQAQGATQGGNAFFETVILRAGQTSLQLNVTLDASTNLAAGTLQEIIDPAPSTPPAAAAIAGWRNVWSKTVKPSTRLGRHTFRLSGPDGTSSIPKGFGTGFLDVSSTGVASVTGNLADGTPFSSSASLGPNGQVLLFGLLYGNGGSILGSLQVRQGANGVELVNHPVSGSVSWRKPAVATDRLYPGGLGLTPSSPLVLTANGGRYTPPAPGKLILGLPDVQAPAAEFINLRFAEGGIANPASVLDVPSIEIRPQASITMPPLGQGNPANATLRVDPLSGAFSGTTTLQDGSLRSVGYQGVITRDSRPASLTTNLANNHDDLVFTTYDGGLDKNNITIRYVDPAAALATLSVSVSGQAITVSLGTGPGTAQVETATVTGNPQNSGVLNVLVTASAVSGSPLTIPVVLSTSQSTSDAVAAAIRTAFSSRSALTASYTVGGTGANITLTRTVAASNDPTLNISWGSNVTGVSALASSANTVTGIAPTEITSTAAQVGAAIAAKAEASALVTVSLASGNNGSGVVTAMPATNLTGAQDNKLRGYGYFLMPQIPGSGQTPLTSPILSGSVILDEKP